MLVTIVCPSFFKKKKKSFSFSFSSSSLYELTWNVEQRLDERARLHFRLVVHAKLTSYPCKIIDETYRRRIHLFIFYFHRLFCLFYDLFHAFFRRNYHGGSNAVRILPKVGLVDRSTRRQIAYKYCYPNPSESISQDFFVKKEKNVSLSGLIYSSGSRSFLWGFLRPLYGTNWKFFISVSTSMFLLMNITPVALSSSSEMINFRQPSGLRTISLT